MERIFLCLSRQLALGEASVLVTLTQTSGSVPRGAGAQLLADRTGLLCGTVGGGSIERECLAYCLTLLAERRSDTRSFTLNAGGALGMVCGGSVTAYFQYIPADSAVWRKLCADVTARLCENAPGFLVLPTDGGAPHLAAAPEDAHGVFLPLPQRERALLFGAGHVARALCPLLSRVSFWPVVYDARADFVTPERFPDANLLICGSFEEIAAHLTVTEEDYVIVMTSGHRFDTLVQEQLLRGDFAYFGVIGSRRKKAAVQEALRQAGIPEEKLALVHTPIGLPIRAETPEEIAVSIAAEMILHRAERREQRAVPAVLVR